MIVKAIRPRAALSAIALALLGAAYAQRLAYPTTPVRNVIDVYHGHAVVDPYRWLENGKNPAVRAWAAAQTKLALAFLHAQPAYPFYERRVRTLATTSTRRFGLTIAGGRYIYFRQTPAQAQPELIARDGLHGTERVLDTGARRGGAPLAIESVFAAPDGSKVAFTTQIGGAEAETLHVVDATTGAALPDTLPRVGGGTSPSALVWDADGKGFVHTLWPRKPDGSYAASGILLYHHTLGTPPAADTYVFGKGLPPDAEYALVESRDGIDQAAFVTAGDGVHASIYLRHAGGPFALAATPDAASGDSAEAGGRFVGNSLYVISKKRDPRGEIVAIPPGGTFASAKTVVPPSALVIADLLEIPGGFLTADIDGGSSVSRSFAADGTPRGRLPLPELSSIADFAADPAGGEIVVGSTSYTTPRVWLAYDPVSNTLTPTGIETKVPGDYSRVVAERVFVPSLDGKVKIPLDIVHLRDFERNGSAMANLTAYGAYGTISSPGFIGYDLAWLERGGIFAQAMVRGGGEYGDAWHEAAHLATKTLSSDDLAACASWLERNGYTSPRHLGISGGSAGGYLMGLALTRDPQLYRAVLSYVGFYDLLRAQTTPNGAFNTPEFGTTEDPAQFAWMVKQSPYERVVSKRTYPAVLFDTGENDPRVDPYDSRKMIARLQASSPSPYPHLLVQRAGSGHGIGDSFDQRVERGVDGLTFLESQLR